MTTTARATPEVRLDLVVEGVVQGVGFRPFVYRLAMAWPSPSGLGTVSRAVGEEAAARGAWQRALAVFDELGVPEAGEVRALLS